MSTCFALALSSALALAGSDAHAGWIASKPARAGGGLGGSARMSFICAHPHQKFHVAPMQAYTNRHLRKLCRLLSKEAVLWTEMEKTEDILESDAAAERRLRHDASERCVLQLGGNEITRLKSACRVANKYGFNEVNLNCGCPSVETGGANFGATMMLDPASTGDACSAMADVSRAPISVKCRLGAHLKTREDGALPEDRFEALADFVRVVSERAPVKHFVVHCRAAVLCGLSPAKNRSVPPLRPEFVLRLAEEFPNLEFTLNGGIRGIHDATRTLAAHPSLHGVMAGRLVLRRPLDLAHLDTALLGCGDADVARAGGHPATWQNAVLNAMQDYFEYSRLEALDKRAALHELATPLILVHEHLRSICTALDDADDDDARDAADMWYDEEFLQEAHMALDRGIGDLIDLKSGRPRGGAGVMGRETLSWRQTAKMLEKACGKKVYIMHIIYMCMCG